MTAFPQASVHVIVPAYNEARVIATTLAPLLASGYRAIVVDDCSTDETWSVLERLPVVRLRHAINLGQGAALQTGMEYALRKGATVVVHFDADGQHDCAQISRLIRPILEGEADVVFGSRFLQESDSRKVPWFKRLVLRGGTVVNGLGTGLWLTDAHNGFRALSAKALSRIRLRENGFAHATEILEEVKRASLRFVEVPTTITYTGYSLAKGQPVSNAINIVVDIVVRKIFS